MPIHLLDLEVPEQERHARSPSIAELADDELEIGLAGTHPHVRVAALPVVGLDVCLDDLRALMDTGLPSPDRRLRPTVPKKPAMAHNEV